MFVRNLYVGVSVGGGVGAVSGICMGDGVGVASGICVGDGVCAVSGIGLSDGVGAGVGIGVDGSEHPNNDIIINKHNTDIDSLLSTYVFLLVCGYIIIVDSPFWCNPSCLK